METKTPSSNPFHSLLPTPFFTLLLLRKCCWKFLHLFRVSLPPTPALILHIPSLINPFPTPCIPLAVLYTRQYVRLCPALAIVKIWPKKCVHGEGRETETERGGGHGRKRDRERWMLKTLQHQSLSLSHPYLHTLSFSEKLSLPPVSFITSPRLRTSSHFNRFHLRACE
jgi:hypothetical protein